jgi:cell division transport system permease protein
VGATPGFIRRPFLYSGFWVGAIAAMVALLLTQAAYWLLEGPLSTLAQSYQIPVVPSLPSPLMSLFLVCVMGGMGVLGSALAVRQQLRGIWPTH